MNTHRAFVPLLTCALTLVVSAGCKVKDTPPQPASDGGRDGDAGAPPAATTDGGPDADAARTLLITSPTTTAYTSGAVTIKAALEGATPSTPVEFVLLPDDHVLGAAAATPYAFTWDTSQQPEGTYQLIVRATAGGDTLMSAPVSIVVDRTPPVIQSQTPLSGATNVFLSDPIELAASEPLAPGTISAATIRLSSGGTAIPAAASLSSDGTTIILIASPPAGLPLPAQVSATFSNPITDLAGNPLVPPSGTWTWTAPIWVDRGNLTGQNPSLALDPHGNPVIAAAVQETPGASTYQIALAHYLPGQGWVQIDPPTTAGVDAVTSLALDSTGAPVLAWSKDHVFLARATGSLLSPWDLSYGLVDTIASQSAREPSLALDAADVPVVAWAYPNGHTDIVYASRWSPATVSWQPLFTGGAAIGAGTPALRMDATGAPLVVSFMTSNGAVARFASGAWVTVDTAPATSYATDAFVADLRTDATNRTAIVVPSPSAARIRLASLAGTTWQDLTPPVVTAVGVTTARLVFDSAGAPLVLWTESNSNLRVARWTGTLWDYSFGTVLPANGVGTPVAAPALAVDKSGRPVIAWSEASGGQILTYVQQSNR